VGLALLVDVDVAISGLGPGVSAMVGGGSAGFLDAPSFSKRPFILLYSMREFQVIESRSSMFQLRSLTVYTLAVAIHLRLGLERVQTFIKLSRAFEVYSLGIMAFTIDIVWTKSELEEYYKLVQCSPLAPPCLWLMHWLVLANLSKHIQLGCSLVHSLCMRLSSNFIARTL
jgi:hypothetical protein